MEINEFTEILEEEMNDADCIIEELEDIIASHEESIFTAQTEIEFVSGRKCLACSLMAQIIGDIPEEVY